MNEELSAQLANLAELSDDELGGLEGRLVAEAEAAAEAVDADALEEIATGVKAVRDERAKRLRAAEETRARVDELMKSIRPSSTPAAAEPAPEVRPPAPVSRAAPADDPFEVAARRELVHGPKWAFRIHLGVYAAVQVLLFVIWATTSHGSGATVPWFLYPLFGWGIGLVAHYLVMRSWLAKAEPHT